MGKHDTSSLSGDLEPVNIHLARAMPLGNPLRSSGSEAPPPPEEDKLACRASQEISGGADPWQFPQLPPRIDPAKRRRAIAAKKQRRAPD